jgi:hypothetical protein
VLFGKTNRYETTDCPEGEGDAGRRRREPFLLQILENKTNKSIFSSPRTGSQENLRRKKNSSQTWGTQEIVPKN